MSVAYGWSLGWKEDSSSLSSHLLELPQPIRFHLIYLSIYLSIYLIYILSYLCLSPIDR